MNDEGEERTARINENSDKSLLPVGRVLALDLGTRRIGVAVSDERQIAVTRLAPLPRTNWKILLHSIRDLRNHFDAQAVVIGLPLNMDGSKGSAAHEAERISRNLALSLNLPVFLQDERLTSRAAEEMLRARGLTREEIRRHVDGEAAAIILRDFFASLESSNHPNLV